MASPINPPRGMRDFLPADKARRERALQTIKRVYSRHGFDEIETPVVEDYDRLHSGLGGDNEKLSYSILRRGVDEGDLRAAAESGDTSGLTDLGLRFDLTVPLARFYASHRGELPTVFRALQTGAVWRAERPQKGRYRQFVQCDIDILGEAGQLAEIELISATTAALDELGLTDSSVRVNDRRILTRLLASWNVPADLTDRALITIDKLDKVGADGVVAELAGLGVTVDGIAESLGALSSAGWDLLEAPGGAPDWLDAEVYRELLALREAVPGATMVFDPTLVRGMGYYTGTIFEIAHPSSTSSVAGGGRYDGMIGRFSGQDVPAVGFSLGFERILDLLPVDATVPDQTAVILLYDTRVASARLATAKREALTRFDRVRLEKRPRNTRSLLESAAAQGFTGVVSVDGEGTIGELRPLT